MKTFVPRPWQPPMIEHMLTNPRCAVWAKMGAGKTASTLAAAKSFGMFDAFPVLILGPKRVARNVWPSEPQAWSDFQHLRVVSIEGTQTERFAALAQKSDFYSINYEQLPWLVNHLGIKNWPFKTIIADEATRLKGFRLRQGGQRTAALAKIMPRVERFVELTGTPSPNGLKDLWGQFWFLDGGERLGRTHEAFKDRWFKPSKSGYGIEPFPFAEQEIHALVADLAITIDPWDYLPADQKRVPIEKDIVVDLPPAARRMYDEMERRMYLEIEHALGTHEIEAVNAASRTLKCLQLAAGAVYTDATGGWEPVHDAKIEALESIVEEANGEPVLVAYQFKSDLARILKHFGKRARALDDKKDTEDAWNRGEIPILLAHPASAGHGLNLQRGGRILVDFSSGWDLEHDDQIIERVGPMRQLQAGLDRAVYRYRIMANRTVDFLVAERRATKRSVQDLLLEAMKRR